MTKIKTGLEGLMSSASLKEINPSGFKFVDINKIIDNPFNKTRQTEDNIDIIKKSIISAGLLTALIVIPKNDKYMLISGHGRLAALKKLDKYLFNGMEHTTDEVPVFIDKSNRSQIENDLNVIRANSQKDEQVSDKIETVRKVEEIYLLLRQNHHITEADNETKRHFISSITGYSESSVKLYLQKLKPKVDTGKKKKPKEKPLPKIIDELNNKVDELKLTHNLAKLSKTYPQEFEIIKNLNNYLKWLIDINEK
ncbi:MAG: ParB N-terminal domain-containing protein [Erysipelotrichaceae bacterium]|nr:ParB N-terminal domain-containing protein [Erysipelotrichaceae bacterium]